MKSKIFGTCGMILLLTTGLKAQQDSPVYQLNSIAEQELAKAKTSGGDVFYSLNKEIFENGLLKVDDEIQIQTPEGEEQLRITRVSRFIPGTVSYRAVSQGGAVFSFTYAHDVLLGHFHKKGKQHYRFNYSARAKQNFITTQQADELACGDEQVFDTGEIPGISKSKTAESVPVTNFYSDLESETIIDILITYTNLAEGWAIQNYGIFGMSTVLAESMNMSQTALDNSGIPITLRVVHSYENTYDEGFSNTDSGEILRQLTASPTYNPFNISDGELDEVHDLRDQYGADLVTIYARVDDTGGLAWRLNDPLGSPRFGFSLNRVQQTVSGFTVVHELGHNMGLSHSRTQETQQADIQGGVFQESVGYQSLDDGTHTVMAYGTYTGGVSLSSIPVFSNPDMEWEGNSAGISEETEIANAALSLKRIKGVISNYRLTTTDPPFVELDLGSITVNMNREETATVNIPIENNGDSNLEYSIDFTSTEGIVFKRGKSKGIETSAESDTLYHTSFESEDNFSSSVKFAANSWRVGYNFFRSFGDQAQFNIKTTNPASGSNHIRIEEDGSANTKIFYSPFFGVMPYGTYRASLDVSISDIAGIENEQFDILFYEAMSGNVSAGFIIDNGEFSVRTIDESGNGSYVSTGLQATPGSYQKLEVEYNVTDEVIRYYIAGAMVQETGFQTEGNIPSELVVVFTNQVAGSFIDIDDFTIVRETNPYEWLSVTNQSGTVEPGNSVNVQLNFSTVGVDAGVYNANLIYRSNEAGLPEYQVPITLDVANVVSNEEETDEAFSFRLNQNYPNPFNPSTSISFRIPEAGAVSLKVFNVLGQEVATLVDQRMNAGEHNIEFDASGLSSGIYIYRLKTEGAELSKKMMLVK